jgi:hypothetical protein
MGRVLADLEKERREVERRTRSILGRDPVAFFAENDAKSDEKGALDRLSD